MLKPTADELTAILAEHAKYLRGEDGGKRADLQGADLRVADLQGAVLLGADLLGAVLRGADLWGADLREADLREADLQGADLQGACLQGADLQGTDLQGADLQRADLQGADLQGADLRGADLRGTILAQMLTAYDWATQNQCEMRILNFRTLCLGSRTQNQPTVGVPDYKLGRLYVAPVFSRCPITSCHPGLYVAGGPDTEKMLVAFWLDEAMIVEKCRVPRFRTLATRDEFEVLTATDMEPVAEETT